MLREGLARIVRGLAIGVGLLAAAGTAQADDANKTLKIGVIYDLTGPFAGGGSELHYLGAKTMIDYFISKGPIDGYKIEAVYADLQSKPDVAINEAVRLIEQEKVVPSSDYSNLDAPSLRKQACRYPHRQGFSFTPPRHQAERSPSKQSALSRSRASER